VFAVALALVATVVGLGARALLVGWPAKILGDVCWTLDVYALARFLGPGQPRRRIAAIVLLVSFGVELLQLTPLPAALSSRSVLWKLLLGSHFHAGDLLSYASAVVLAVGLERLSATGSSPSGATAPAQRRHP
jgi:hypothetical protein